MQQIPRWLWAVLGVFTLAVLAALALILTAPTPSTTITLEQQNDFDGITVINPARPMENFTLTSHENKPISLYDLKGKPTLLYFGFTNCPDVCPLTLYELRKIRERLGEDANKLHYVFISVDGARDTPAALRTMFSNNKVQDFMLGMTGDSEYVREIGKPYNVHFSYGKPNEQGYYTVEHTASAYLLDKDSQWIRRYAYATDFAIIADDLKAIVSN